MPIEGLTADAKLFAQVGDDGASLLQSPARHLARTCSRKTKHCSFCYFVVTWYLMTSWFRVFLVVSNSLFISIGGDINVLPKFCWWIDLLNPQLRPRLLGNMLEMAVWCGR